MKKERRKSKKVMVGNIVIGKDSQISVQSMLKVPTVNIKACMTQIEQLKTEGCDIIRVAIPDENSARAFSKIRKNTSIALVADIHFDYKLALMAAKAGANKIRLNPGNISSPEKIKLIAESAKAHGIPIRVGVNSGSMPKDLSNGKLTANKMVTAALREVELLEKYDFDDIVIAIKSHDPALTISANRLLAEKTHYPIHLGVTEAGLPSMGEIKSAIGIGSLLCDGIGDTIRVSLTGDPVQEVIVGKRILKACGLASSGIDLVSCPTCGRCRVCVEKTALQVLQNLPSTDKNLTVAVMGCEVNGPGEAKSADIGIAGGNGFFIMFKKGKIIGKFPQDQIVDRLIDEINYIIEE